MNSASGSKPFSLAIVARVRLLVCREGRGLQVRFSGSQILTFSSSVSFLVRVPHLELLTFEFAQVGKSVRQVAQLISFISSVRLAVAGNEGTVAPRLRVRGLF